MWSQPPEPPSKRWPAQGHRGLLSQFTLQDLGSLGEFVGAIGVVISLVYLARQMQQNTTSVRAASFNSMTENSIRLLEHSLGVPGSRISSTVRSRTHPPCRLVRWYAGTLT